MIVLRREKLDNWLEIIDRNQNWLAEELGFTDGYVSQVLNNQCRISSLFIERILRLTSFQFEDLFYYDGNQDLRHFYGRTHIVNKEIMYNDAYKKLVGMITDESEKKLIDN